MRAADGMLYGLDAAGGLLGGGVLYRVDPSIDSYSPLYNFNYATGASPMGGLIQLSDGKLYGMTYGGGQYSAGVIFSFDPVASTYLDLYDFNLSGGGYPMYGSLLKASDGKLYGLTSGGGTGQNGVIFSYDVINDTYTDLYDFNNSGYPNGSLIQANNGLLYGMTASGGTYAGGVIFSYDISTQSYTSLYNFTTSDGTYPQRSLTQGSNGKLFGTTSSSGLYGGGTAFSFDITSNTFTKLVEFGMLGCSGSSCDILETGAKQVATNVPLAQAENTDDLITYPNPATDHVTVLGKILTPKSQVELLDNHGKQIVDFTMKGNTLNVSDLSPGLYILKITADNRVAVGKFVKGE